MLQGLQQVHPQFGAFLARACKVGCQLARAPGYFQIAIFKTAAHISRIAQGQSSLFMRHLGCELPRLCSCARSTTKIMHAILRLASSRAMHPAGYVLLDTYVRWGRRHPRTASAASRVVHRIAADADRRVHALISTQLHYRLIQANSTADRWGQWSAILQQDTWQADSAQGHVRRDWGSNA